MHDKLTYGHTGKPKGKIMRSEIAKRILEKPLKLLDNNGKEIKPGQVIKIEARFEGWADYCPNGKYKVVDINTFGRDITVQFPDGTKRVIDWIEFIIYILPLIEKIFFIVRGWFTKKTK
jgi:hypothetical protein